MLIHKNTRFTIYFGDADHAISTEEITQQKNNSALQTIAQHVQANNMVFLHQNHGTQGMYVQPDDPNNYYFQSPGDYLFTQKKACGLGVVTADCLPIVLYDPTTHTAGIIHAGWKGLVAGVFQTAVHDMIATTKIDLTSLQIYVGPAARPCCYAVQQDFIDKFAAFQEYFHEFLSEKNGITYFDSTAFITVIVRSLGIGQEKLYTRCNLCTICNLSFCSYRREKEKARRQATMICLH